MTTKRLEIEYEEFSSLDALSPEEQALAAEAMKVRANTYAPYSGFAVGAALRTADGRVFVGCNQETVNFKGSCAERVALDTASSAGCKNLVRIIAICGAPQHTDHIAHDAELGPISPCGQCRQDLKEFEDLGGEDMVVLLVSAGMIRRFTGMRHLLPFGVGPRGLGDTILA